MAKQTTKKETIKKIETELSGVAGEFFVAAELSRKGYLATLTQRNTKGVDILVSNASASKSATIQVKTNQGHLESDKIILFEPAIHFKINKFKYS